MVNIGILCLAAVLCSAGEGPDRTESWRSFELTGIQGDDYMVDCTRQADLSAFHCVVFNSDRGTWSWRLVSLNRYGRATGETLLLSDEGELGHWLTPCFTDHGTLAVFYGSRLGQGPATLLTLSCSNPGEFVQSELSGPFAAYQEIAVTSAVQTEEGILIAGAGYADSSGSAFFTAVVDESGSVVWHRELPGFLHLQLEDTSMEVLRSGSFMLSFEEDAFASGISAALMDDDGREARRSFIELDSEFTAVINDFLELDDGDILCAGTFDQLGTMRLRGVLVLFDPALQEIWKKTFWYWDQTELNSIQLTEEGEILCGGWTGTSRPNSFDVEMMDVLLAFVEPESGSVYGVSIEEAGNERPCAVFEGGFGEYFVLGEHTPENGGDSDIFFGRVVLGN